VPAWKPEQRVVIHCPAYLLPQPEMPNAASHGHRTSANKKMLRARARKLYGIYMKPHLPRRVKKYFALAARAATSTGEVNQGEVRIPYALSPTLNLSGVVYASILDPFDTTTDWQDMLSAYLLALRDTADATLVVKLAVPAA